MITDRTLFSPDRIRVRVEELAEEIASASEGMDLVLVGALRGAFIFLADLVRALSVPVALDFIAVSSYGDSTGTTNVTFAGLPTGTGKFSIGGGESGGHDYLMVTRTA